MITILFDSSKMGKWRKRLIRVTLVIAKGCIPEKSEEIGTKYRAIESIMKPLSVVFCHVASC